MVSISLKDEELNAILTKAILDGLSDEAKNTIIGDAVRHLNEKIAPQGYNDPNRDKTILQVAFQNGVDMLINRVVMDLLKDTMYDSVKEQVKVLLDTFPPIQNDPALQVKVAETIMEHMRQTTRDRY